MELNYRFILTGTLLIILLGFQESNEAGVIPSNVHVALSSNLNVGATAFDNQIVTFECTIQATGIVILSWSSDDYVGHGGTLLQVASVHSPGRTVTSPVNPNTVATLVSVTTNPDTGVTEVVSSLRITTSAQYPTSSVSCRLDNHGTPNTTIFSVIPSNVALSSNLNRATAFVNQIVTFECIIQATGIVIVSWSSDDYVGPGGTLLQVASVHDPGRTAASPVNQNTVATLVSITTNPDTGVTEIVSSLRITASERYPTSAVSCRLDNHGTRNTITFSITPSDVILSYNLTGDTAYDTQTVTFDCRIRCTNRSLTWRIDDHSGPENTIEFTDDDEVTAQKHSQLRSATATLISATMNMSTGVTVMKSVLHIVASMEFPNSSISCESLGVINVTRFWTIPIATAVESLDGMVTTVGNSDETLTSYSSTGSYAAVSAVGVTAVTLILVTVTIISITYTYRKYYIIRKARDQDKLKSMMERESESTVVGHRRSNSYPSSLIRRQQPIPKNRVSMENSNI